jgi:hypothetical protein
LTKTPDLACISCLPRIVFSVSATSAPTEREFKRAGRNATTGRAALSEDKVEMMAVISSISKQLGAEKWNAWVEERLQVLSEVES